MKSFFRPQISRMFGLHDCIVNRIELNGNNIELFFPDGFNRISAGEEKVKGSITIENADLDFCYVYILSNFGKEGSFKGKKLSLRDFIRKYKSYSFEITDEAYDQWKISYSGYIWYSRFGRRLCREMTVSIGYYTGNIVYNVED